MYIIHYQAFHVPMSVIGANTELSGLMGIGRRLELFITT